MRPLNLSTWSLVGVIALLASFGVLSRSPLKKSLGRHNPAAAAWLTPPWFNFSADYNNGTVLDFRVGMTRAELAEALKNHYASNSVLLGGCGNNKKTGSPDVQIGSAEGSKIMATEAVVCLWNPSKRMTIFFSLQNNALSEIEVSIIHSEM